jgi:hypothetical protein
MNRLKRIFALTIVFILIFSLVLEVQPLSDANPANPYPSIGIIDPQVWWYKCYSNASIPLKIGVLLVNTSTPRVYSPQVDNISYSLDSKDNVTLTNLMPEGWAKTNPDDPVVSFTVSSTLHNLSEGNHTLRAYSSDGKLVTDERIFTVDSTYKNPEIALISPRNITYSTNQVPLIFSLNKDEYKNTLYRLDYDSGSSKAINIDGNTTLTNLTEGFHKILVSAVCIDKYHKYGVAIAQGIGFTIDKDAQTSNPSPAVPEFPSVLAIVFLIIATLSFTVAIKRKKILVISR